METFMRTLEQACQTRATKASKTAEGAANGPKIRQWATFIKK